MPHVAAALDPEVHLALIRRVQAGDSRFAVALDLGLHEGTAYKWTAHVPDGRKTDLVKASIIARAKNGEDVRTIASLENCSVGFVVKILHAWAGELDACARLSAMKAPRRRGEKR